MKKQLLIGGLVTATALVVGYGVQSHNDAQAKQAAHTAQVQQLQTNQLAKAKLEAAGYRVAMQARYNVLLAQCKEGADAYALLSPLAKSRYLAVHHNQVPVCPGL